jgi:hypothetical protein
MGLLDYKVSILSHILRNFKDIVNGFCTPCRKYKAILELQKLARCSWLVCLRVPTEICISQRPMRHRWERNPLLGVTH